MTACEGLCDPIEGGAESLPLWGLSERIWPDFGQCLGTGHNGAHGEAQRSGFAGERRSSGMSEFSPFGAETREKVNCSAGAREAALGRMELATTTSRRKPWRFCRAGQSQPPAVRAVSGDGC